LKVLGKTLVKRKKYFFFENNHKLLQSSKFQVYTCAGCLEIDDLKKQEIWPRKSLSRYLFTLFHLKIILPNIVFFNCALKGNKKPTSENIFQLNRMYGVTIQKLLRYNILLSFLINKSPGNGSRYELPDCSLGLIIIRFQN
jgi:hypothetical protein